MLLKSRIKLGRAVTLLLPFIISILFLINNSIVYFTNYDNTFLGYLFSINPLIIIYLYINSSIYGLCSHHKMFIHYLLVAYLMCIYDVYIGIPITDKELLISHYIVFGIAVVLYGILKYKDNKNHK